MGNRKQAVASEDFDLSGFPVTRTIRQTIRSRLMPIGNFGGGPGWLNLFTVFFLHRAPHAFYWLTMFFERQAEILYRRLAALFSAREKANEADE